MKLSFSVTALIFNKEGQLLSVSRKTNHNDFGLPGGKVDFGESLVDALVREVKEETGLDVIVSRQIFGNLSPSKSFYTHTYLCEVEGTIGTEEAGIVKWTDWKEIETGSSSEYNQVLHIVYNKLKEDGII